jgi:DNA replication and repair protein RecF
MHLENIFIDRFRCLSHLETPLPPGRILIIGNNATGKTSVLEAIFYLVTGRSFRTRLDGDCLPWQSPPGAFSVVRASIRHAAGDSCRLAVTLGSGGKSVRIDNQSINRLASLWGRLRAVLFTPDDLQLVKGGPAERRRYLDVALSQINPDYLFRLQRYNAALRQRNALLKRADLSIQTLRENIAPWNAQLAEQAIPILMMRRDFLEGLEPRTAQMYGKFLSEEHAATETIRLSYNSSLRFAPPQGSDLEQSLQAARMQMAECLQTNLEDDRRRGQTSIGPHRDDFQVHLSGKPARDFASQGQVRSIVLALRFAEAQEMEARTGEPPVALLDDIASELDPVRKARLLDLLQPRWQTFMTTTRREDFPEDSHFDAVLLLPLEKTTS